MQSKLVVLLLVLSAAAANADDQGAGTRHFSVFLQDLQISSSTQGGSDSGASAGISLGHSWSNRISTALSVTAQRYPQMYVTFEGLNAGGNPTPVTRRGTLTTYPVDLVNEIAFSNPTRWTPYVGLGLRYVRAPFDTNRSGSNESAPVSVSPVYANRLDGEAVGGVRLRVTRDMDVQLGLARLLRSQSIPDHDPLTRGNLGLHWRF